MWYSLGSHFINHAAAVYPQLDIPRANVDNSDVMEAIGSVVKEFLAKRDHRKGSILNNHTVDIKNTELKGSSFVLMCELWV